MSKNAGIRFVSQTGCKKEDDSTTRKAIRRHVMLGKNRGRTPQNPRQPAMQGTAVFRADDWQQHPPQPPAILPKAEEQSSTAVIPPQLGTSLSLLTFADTVEPPLMNDTLHFCTSTNKNMFVLAPCIAFETPDPMTNCLPRLAHDALYLNIMAFGTEHYLHRQELQGSCLMHYGRALTILRERLVEVEAICDVTVSCVVILAMNALATGQVGSARNHVEGVGRMMKLRGRGMKEGGTRAMVDLVRCDVSVALAMGNEPILFQGSRFPLPDFEACEERRPPVENDNLARIWTVLSRFCAVVNKAAIGQTNLPESMLLETMASVIYGLLGISLSTDSIDEAIRLAMLSFCASAFLYWGQLRLPLDWLRDEYRRCLNGMMQRPFDKLDLRMVLWMLIVHEITFPAVTADEGDEIRKWLRETIKECGLTGWDHVRRAMSEFLWIDIVCTQPGRELVAKILPGESI